MEKNTQVERIHLKRVELSSNEDVYDITVRKNHNFFANGLLIHNCCEVSLEPFSFCNLTEINASDVESQVDLNNRARAGSFIGTLQAAYTDFHYLRPIWKETTEKDALIGVSFTGIASNKLKPLNLQEAAENVKSENERIAGIININKAKRTTVLKPAGSTSCVVGSSSGIHAWHNDYYIRRMRVGKTEALYKYLKDKIPDLIEDCKFKPHLESVLSLPQKAPEGSILRFERVTTFLNRVKRYNIEWIRNGHREGDNYNNVSCTVSIKNNEWELVGEWMWKNRDDYTGISILPYNDHTYVQAPFEDCSEEEYHRMMALCKDIDLSQVIESDDHTSHNEIVACAGGACEIK